MHPDGIAACGGVGGKDVLLQPQLSSQQLRFYVSPNNHPTQNASLKQTKKLP